MKEQNTSMVPAAAAAVPANYKTDLQTFETGLMRFIEQHGLPTTNVLIPVAERASHQRGLTGAGTLLPLLMDLVFSSPVS